MLTHLPTRILLAALLLGCSSAGARSTVPSAAPGTASSAAVALAPRSAATRQRIEAHMGFLASDALRGRETGTAEGTITAAYVAAVMQGMGLKGAAEEGGFTQDYPLHRSRLDLGTIELSVAGGPSWDPLDDFTLRGLGFAPVDLVGGVVFAGYGLIDQQTGLDQLDEVDIEGRFVAVMEGLPSGVEDAGERASSSARGEAVIQRGGLGLILLSGPDDVRAARTRGWLRRAMTHPRMVLGDAGEEPEANVRVYPEPAVAAALFAAAGRDFDAELGHREQHPWAPGFVLEGVELTLRAQLSVDELSAQNVAGLLLGDDPELSDEVIVLSAHNDHIGVSSDGAINHGADDNASGTATLLAVAEALTELPGRLRRSVLFLSVSGEEKGLLGSSWWVQHPTLPLDNIIADINIDMVGRNDPDAIGITPSPEHPDYNSLVPEAVQAGAQVGLSVGWFAGEGKYRRRVDSYYSRSDHANFAKQGIPVMFLFAGEHEDYHRPGDTLDKIDFNKVARVAKLVETLVVSVADAEGRPVRLLD